MDELDRIVSKYFSWTVERWHKEGLAEIMAWRDEQIAAHDLAKRKALEAAIGPDFPGYGGDIVNAEKHRIQEAVARIYWEPARAKRN